MLTWAPLQCRCPGHINDAHLVKVCGEPVHHDVEGIMECKVVDDDGPDGGLSQHAQPWGGRCSTLLFRFSRSQWDGC